MQAIGTKTTANPIVRGSPAAQLQARKIVGVAPRLEDGSADVVRRKALAPGAFVAVALRAQVLLPGLEPLHRALVAQVMCVPQRDRECVCVCLLLGVK